MRANKAWWSALVVILLTPAARAQNDIAFKPSMGIDRVSPVQFNVHYTGTAPSEQSGYYDEHNWKAQWRAHASDPENDMSVDKVKPSATNKNTFVVILHSNPATTQRVNDLLWTISFEAPGLHTDRVEYIPNSSITKSCTADVGKPLFCPPSGKTTPDFTMSGSFLAAGGTNPIYAFEVKGGFLFPPSTPMFHFHPAINTQVEINQNTKPPSNRTRFDPDSITAAFALSNRVTFDNSVLQGARFQLQLPAGEFSRADPSSNIILGGLGALDFTAIQPTDTVYAVIRPFFGFEAGRNLNRPSVIDKVPVDLSHYRGIFRGYMGADATLAKVDPKDVTTNIFSLTGTYRVRLPAIDEPFIETIHQTTTVSLTTKARHWFEGDLAYVIPSWKYLSINGSYQYGELPPMFTFVDHKFTIGFKLQVVQSRKDASLKLIQ